MDTEQKDAKVHERLLSTVETAKILDVSPRTLFSWTKNGRLACVKIDRTKRYRLRDIVKFIEANTIIGKSTKARFE